MTAHSISRANPSMMSDDKAERRRPLGMMKSEFAADQIGAMRKQEESESYRCRDYLADAYDEMTDDDGGEGRGPVDENCRRKMCIWCCQVVDFFKFSTRETVFMASAYLDRFLSSSDDAPQKALRDRKEYQLFSMTALYLAIKVHETIEVDVSIMSKLSRGDYRKEDFVRAETDLITTLGWRLNGPTPTEFVRRFVSLLRPQSTCSDSNSISSSNEGQEDTASSISNEYMLMDFARFQTEISVTDYTFVVTRPSLIATASVLNAIDTIENLTMSMQQKKEFAQAIAQAADIDLQSPEVACVREQLRIRFNKSRGYSAICSSDARSVYTYSTENDVAMDKNSSRIHVGADKECATTCPSSSNESSPVCVGRR